MTCRLAHNEKVFPNSFIQKLSRHHPRCFWEKPSLAKLLDFCLEPHPLLADSAPLRLGYLGLDTFFPKSRPICGKPSMATLALDKNDLLVLRSILRHRRPDLLPLYNRIGHENLTEDDRLLLQGAVRLEYLDTGIGRDRLPNSKGLILDDLMQRIAYLR